MFETVTANNFHEFQERIEPFMQSSDFYPVTALGYGQGKHISYYCEPNFAVANFIDYVETGSVTAICIRPNTPTDTVIHAVNLLRRVGFRKLRLVPKQTLKILLKSYDLEFRFLLSDADYVYNTDSLSKLAGSSLRRRRREVRAFQRESVDLSCNIKTTLSQYEMGEVDRLTEAWNDSYHGDGNADIAATSSFFQFHTLTRAETILVRQRGYLVAFCVFELLSNGLGVFHFVKGHPEVRGATTYTLSQVAKLMSERGVSMVNFAFDMGIGGLRDYKQSLQPAGMIEKAELWL